MLHQSGLPAYQRGNKRENAVWDLCCVYIDLPVTMPTDIGFLLSKVKLYCFQGSIQLRVVKMAFVLGCSSNAVLAETGAKRLIKEHVNRQTTSKQTIGHQYKRDSRCNQPIICSIYSNSYG